MCGIAGFFSSDMAPQEFPSTMKKMLEMIGHRGPDDAGCFFDETAALGSVRLSIIDLESGQQPLCDEGGRYWIVYNGEVYNYKELHEELAAAGYHFSTASDTEVVLKAWIAWGADCLERLNGGYAFAIYDQRDQVLVLVRDRYGERPLYYTRSGRALVFASEMKAFLSYPGISFSWNADELRSIFATWAPLTEETGFNDICQVGPGAYLRLTASQVSKAQYYKLGFPRPTFDGSENEAIETTRHKLSESVRLRMRSDVEVGTYLSGGLDSAIVTLLAKEHNPRKIRTFSVAFEDSEFDESLDQEHLSKFLDTSHTSLRVTNEEIGRDFPKAVWHAEVPLFRTALVPFYSLSEEVRRQGIKVVLTGEGSDESFLGYDIFKETLIRRLWKSGASEEEKKELVSGLYPYLRHFNTENIKSLAGVYNQFSMVADSVLFSHDMRFSNSRFALRLLAGTSEDNGLKALLRLGQERLQPMTDIGRAQWLEFTTLLAGYLLSSQGDRMSLANGVENRCPFMDYNVVEWAATLPIELRLKNLKEEKYILKKAFAGVLPENILKKPKQPYRAPDTASFLCRAKPEYLDALLSADSFAKIPVLDAAFCARVSKKLLQTAPENISPRENQSFVLLLSLVLLNEYFVERRGQFNCRFPLKGWSVYDRRHHLRERS